MSEARFVSKEAIEKGWSGDKKYCVRTAEGIKYLLRISPKEKSANRKELFRLEKELIALGLPMSTTIEYGKCDEGFYALQTWVEGEDAEDLIPFLAANEQYAYGFEAGKMLKLIHSIPAPANQPPWESYFNRKVDSKIKMYSECPVKIPGAENIVNYLEANRHLLAGRPQSFHHGDYHTGNMMIENGKLVIIDFDRYDFGDPWEEFNRIVWCAQVSPLFASGMIKGYFVNGVPDSFWPLLALYIGSNILSSVPWALPFGERDVKKVLKLGKDVLAWYNNMQTIIPIWYSK